MNNINKINSNKDDEEFSFRSIYWRKVLNEIYLFAPNNYALGKGEFNSEHSLVKRLKLPSKNVWATLQFLIKKGLIKIKGDNDEIFLTSYGFDIAEKNELERLNHEFQVKQNRINRGLFYFTGLIAFTSMVGLFEKGKFSDCVGWVILVMYILIGLGIFFIEIYIRNKENKEFSRRY